jgi:hypothetical protein
MFAAMMLLFPTVGQGGAILQLRLEVQAVRLTGQVTVRRHSVQSRTGTVDGYPSRQYLHGQAELLVEQVNK